MADSPEESSWTFYIEGFMCENGKDDDRNSCFSSEYESPSLVSDAASSAVKKLANIGFSGKSNNSSCAGRTICKQNSFKKQKTRVITAMDIELEDTASSPVNSPRVSYMNQFLNQKEKAKMDASEMKRNVFAKGGVFTVERDTDHTDLKKRTSG
ncbi:hypothetical protein BUALT_Bualt03G0119700 [Buddleja alternifolia]|uniref:Uncharacterized protein n=1 Tax=Buddleja alternifolia TaxID=168488 RepID=A0AAV6Y3V4_9LAMI|nr:hypothetical protein BUALT_Bualt03G0119700 [Buddleja alternifolia]